MTRCLNLESDVFYYIQDNQKIKSRKLLQFNKDIRSIQKSLSLHKSSLFAAGSNTPTYFYVGCIYYLGVVKKQVKEARHLLNKYTSKISSWTNVSRDDCGIDANNMQRKSVVLQLDTRKDQAGTILDASADYSAYLATPDNNGGDVVGCNINDLFPPFIQSQHKAMMTDLSHFSGLLNKERAFFINGFDGYLREMTFIVKIHPSIERDLSSVAIMRMFYQKPYALVLLDFDMNFLAAEEKLLKELGCMELSKDVLSYINLS